MHFPLDHILIVCMFRFEINFYCACIWRKQKQNWSSINKSDRYFISVLALLCPFRLLVVSIYYTKTQAHNDEMFILKSSVNFCTYVCCHDRF